VTEARPEPRAPGLWTPAWAAGIVLSVIVFAVGFVITVSVNERRLDNIDDHLARLDRLDDASAADRREFAVRLGRLEADTAVDRRGHP
jgi:heme exporter protein D